MPEIKKTKHGEKRAKERGFSDEKINDIKIIIHKKSINQGVELYLQKRMAIIMM